MEVPHLNRLYQKYKNQGLVVIGVSSEPDSRVKSFVQRTPIAYTILLNGQAQFQAYSVQGVPSTYYIDKEGIVRYREVGFGPGGEIAIEQKIKELL